MEIKGTIIKISETIQISDRFRKREFVVEYSSNPVYPQVIQFEMVQDRCELLDKHQDGQLVEIHFDLRGREWKNPQGDTKYFNTLQAWKIVPLERQKDTTPQSKKSDMGEKLEHQEKPGWLENENLDDLPF